MYKVFEHEYIRYGGICIHPFSKLLVLCRIVEMLETFPASRTIGKETPWMDGLSSTDMVSTV